MNAEVATRTTLLDAWETPRPYPESAAILDALAPRSRSVLSNGAARMLAAAVETGGPGAALDAVLSADAARVFKPHPRVYALGTDHFGVSAGGSLLPLGQRLGRAGAGAFGFRVAWINRLGWPADRHGPPPVATLGSLNEVPALFEPPTQIEDAERGRGAAVPRPRLLDQCLTPHASLCHREDRLHSVQGVGPTGVRVDDEADDRVGARLQVELDPGSLATRLERGVADEDELGKDRILGRRRAGHHPAELVDDVIGDRPLRHAGHHDMVGMDFAGVGDLPKLRPGRDRVRADDLTELVRLLQGDGCRRLGRLRRSDGCPVPMAVTMSGISVMTSSDPSSGR